MKQKNTPNNLSNAQINEQVRYPIELLTINELAEMLGSSRSTVYRMIDSKTIVSPVMNGALRFVKAEVEEWINDLPRIYTK